VSAVSCSHEPATTDGAEAILAHHTGDSLVIDCNAPCSEFSCHPSISVARKHIMNIINLCGQTLISHPPFRRVRMVIVSASWKFNHFASAPNGAGRGPVTIDELSLLFTRWSRGVFLRRSISIVNCPTFLSSAAIFASYFATTLAAATASFRSPRSY
jgi:hypothetical protein